MAIFRRQIYRKKDYVFTADYLSAQTPALEKYLGEYRGLKNLKLLEIGSYEGRSAVWFLENILTHPTASIICIDPFLEPKRELIFDHNIKVSGFSTKVKKIKGLSENVLQTLEKSSFDVIYIDGSHYALNVLMDGVVSWQLLKPGGIIVFDDYKWRPDKPAIERPSMAIDIFLNAFHSNIQVLHKDYQVFVRKLK